MSPQEREQLSQFLHQLVQAPSVHKDSEAAALIGEACAQQPDAPYLLVQRALLMEQALQQAQAQVTRLQAELEQARAAAPRSGGFLDGNAWGPRPAAPVAPAAPLPQAVPYAAAPASSWGSGWLGNVATTAAGVVAGSFLFQGIEHLLGSHHGSSWFGGDNASSQDLTGNTIVNNYYDGSPDGVDNFDAAALSDGIPLDDAGDDTPDWI